MIPILHTTTAQFINLIHNITNTYTPTTTNTIINNTIPNINIQYFQNPMTTTTNTTSPTLNNFESPINVFQQQFVQKPNNQI